MIPSRFQTPLVWSATSIIVLLAVMLIWWAIASRGEHARQVAQAKAGTALAASRAASAHDAVETTVQASKRDTATDHVTQENRDAIHAAPGASAPVDPALSRAGLDGLCKRTAYHSRPECLQHARTVQP